MNKTTVYTKLLLVLGLATAVLTACTITNDPTPQAPLAEVATATPSPSSTPTATMSLVETAVPTMIPSQTIAPTSTEQPTRTPGPTPTRTPVPLSFEGISNWSLSSSGQLFLVQAGKLLIENPQTSGNFQEIDDFVGFAAWSPDGNKIIYMVQQFQENIQDFKLFNLETNESSSIRSLVENFPASPYRPGFRFMTWKPDNSGILFLTVNEEMPWEGKFFLADFQTNEFTYLIEVYEINKINIFKTLPDGFFTFDHCGAPCEVLSKYDYGGRFLWRIPFATMGRVVFADDNQLVINYGCADGCPREDPINKSIQQFDANTGEAETIWQIGEDEYFNGIEFPELSPDEKYLGFYLHNDDFFTVLEIIDFNGRSYGQRLNSIIMDWRPGGGPVVQESVAEGQAQLVYWPLDGEAVQVFVSPTSFVFGVGKWSGDGRFFIYGAVDEAENQSYLYLWQPESDAPTLLHTAVGTDGFHNFAWLPDSTCVYFNFGQMELWKFEVETEALTLIASSAE